MTSGERFTTSAASRKHPIRVSTSKAKVYNKVAALYPTASQAPDGVPHATLRLRIIFGRSDENANIVASAAHAHTGHAAAQPRAAMNSRRFL